MALASIATYRTLATTTAKAVTPRARPVQVAAQAVVLLVRLVDTSMMAFFPIPVKCAHKTRIVALASTATSRPLPPTRAQAVTPRAPRVAVAAQAVVLLVRLVDTSMMAFFPIPVKCAQQIRIVALASTAPSRSLTPTRAQAVTPRAPRVAAPTARRVVLLVRPTDILTSVLRDPTVLYVRKTRTVQIRSFVTLDWVALTRASRRRGIAGGVPIRAMMDLKLSSA